MLENEGDLNKVDIPRGIEKLVIGQGGSSNFLTGTRDIAKGKDRSEGRKFDGRPTPNQNQFFNHERYKVRKIKKREKGIAKKNIF